MKLLVVDDDIAVLDSLRTILALQGHTVVAAPGGQAGIDAFRTAGEEEPFAAVITDLAMPQIDGHQVAIAVKGMAPAMPVIMMTGWGRPPEDEVCGHVDHYLGKPMRLKELREVLAKLGRAPD